MKKNFKINTLQFFPELCTNCGMCSIVCPHAVFETGEHYVRMVNRQACIECGACMLNCEPGAIKVQAGVGCAAAIIQAALTGRKETTCGPSCDC
jgi:NAD-dependent dihydropyrimidine dehydrogenase PreA subunit